MWIGCDLIGLQARRNIASDSREGDKTTNMYVRTNTQKGDVGQYEEARIKGFRTGRLPFSDDDPDTFVRGDYYNRKRENDENLREELSGKQFLTSVKNVSPGHKMMFPPEAEAEADACC